ARRLPGRSRAACSRAIISSSRPCGTPGDASAMAFSVGIGLTNECNLRCPHCYRPDMVVQRLTLRDVQQVCESLPARPVNLGVGAHLRVNIYQPAKTDRFTLTYEQFWRGFRLLSAATRLVATTEPVLAATLEMPDFAGPGCGRSTVRVAPDGRVLPCTYWPESSLTLADLARLGGAIVETAEFVEAR